MDFGEVSARAVIRQLFNIQFTVFFYCFTVHYSMSAHSKNPDGLKIKENKVHDNFIFNEKK